MEYYEIWVASASFHGKEPLTYGSEASLNIGEIVKIPIQKTHSIGIVNKRVSKPKFATKNISEINEKPRIPQHHLDLIRWLSVYYPAPIGQIVTLFVPQNIDTKNRLIGSDKNSDLENKLIKPPELTPQQSEAVQEISETESPVILHGDTGTGKTRVYIEIAMQKLDSGKSSIILTPEIGLTPQLIKSFSDVFGDRVILVHSNLTPAQKRNVWLKCALSEEPQIVVGPRSALFMPVKNLGLIVIDEFHDGAYKQEQAPHYQTSRVAAKLSKLTDAALILGSATPSVSDYYAFETKKLPIIRMTETATKNNKKETDISIIKINDRACFTNSFWLSNELIDSIRESLNAGQQSLLFLNRRGSARVAMCQKCGWQALCPKCDIPMTYHGDIHRLRCHTCGYKTTAPGVCPDCNSADIEFKGIGTKSIFSEVERLFPNARVARFDSDNDKKENLTSRYKDVKSGEIDILVGTQTLTKGLDLPKLSVVGVITADTALFFPDYTAEELTYQQISQVVGRVGRGHQDSKVIIQTYYPENPALKSIVNKNYSLFYSQQILERKKFNFPPYFYVLKINCGRKSSKNAENSINKLNTLIRDLPLVIDVVGPSPSFKHKQNDKYYWQLIIKAKKREHLTSVIGHLPANFSYDIDPTNLL
jgi:primosomal protein N' (replication factor Y)